MKELSIEEKAKAYDEAIERAKEQAIDGYLDAVAVNDIFPELRESEDERIRKAIYNCVKWFSFDSSFFKDVSQKECIAWLEKQGEQKPVEWSQEDLICLGYLADFVDKNGDDFYGNNKPNVVKWIRSFAELPTHISINEIGQKPDNWIQELEDKLANATPKQLAEWKEKYFKEEPAGWSEDDEKMLEELLDYCDTSIQYNGIKSPQAIKWKKRKEWFKSIKDRVHPKQEWSDDERKVLDEIINDYEKANKSFSGYQARIDWLKSLRPQKQKEWNKGDIEMIDWLIRCCEEEHKELCNDRYGHQEIVSDLKRDCRKKWDWLESLKNKVAPQNHWKPSESDILLLERIANGKSNPQDFQASLGGLIEQLKKLREE